MADMWTDLDRWEADNNAVVFLVVGTEDIRGTLEDYNAFDSDCEEYICEMADVSEKLIFEALTKAYNDLDMHYGLDYECISDYCYDYLVAELNKRVKDSIKTRESKWTPQNRGYYQAQLWNSETKTFESYGNFLARVKGGQDAS